MTGQTERKALPLVGRKDRLREDAFYPTPPWATRVFLRHVLPRVEYAAPKTLSVWEPACGQGHMAEPLREGFGTVTATDLIRRGYGDQHDFLMPYLPAGMQAPDWVITNPPFKLAEAFIDRARAVARRGVAMLLPTRYLEGEGRYQRLFTAAPPTLMAQSVERIPMLKGHYDPAASSNACMCWLVWVRGAAPRPIYWIPPCKDEFFRADDVLIGGDHG